jgi:Spy/CpxP family protein refolding chaperone
MKRLILTTFLLAGLAVGVSAVEINSGSEQNAPKVEPGNAGEPVEFFAQAAPDDSMAMPPDRPFRRGGQFQDGPGFGPVPEEFERLRMKKLFELLQLDEDKQERLREIATDFRSRMMTSMREFTATQDTLATGLREKTLSDAEIERLVGRLENMEAERSVNIATFHSEAREILSLRQYAALLVFEQRFERQVFERMMQRRGKGMGPHQGPPPMPPFDPNSEIEEDSF